MNRYVFYTNPPHNKGLGNTDKKDSVTSDHSYPSNKCSFSSPNINIQSGICLVFFNACPVCYSLLSHIGHIMFCILLSASEQVFPLLASSCS